MTSSKSIKQALRHWERREGGEGTIATSLCAMASYTLSSINSYSHMLLAYRKVFNSIHVDMFSTICKDNYNVMHIVSVHQTWF